MAYSQVSGLIYAILPINPDKVDTSSNTGIKLQAKELRSGLVERGGLSVWLHLTI